LEVMAIEDVAVKGFLALPSGARNTAWRSLSWSTKTKVITTLIKRKICCCL